MTNVTAYFNAEGKDVNGAPEELTDASGQVVWQVMYQGWGRTVDERTPQSDLPEQNLRYQGQYLDRETGLHYNLHRYYDPDVGRFISPDPIGLAGGINLYQYASNPIGWIDPWGLMCGTAGKEQETARVSDLTPTHGRTMSNKQMDKLIKSIRADGVQEPLTVTEYNGKLYILDGHHRALAAPRAGVSEVPVRRVELPFGAYQKSDDLTFTPGGY